MSTPHQSTTPEPGTKKMSASGLYAGVLRDGKTIVWQCEHLHSNRDMSPGIRQSARDCALQEARTRGLVK